MNRRNFMKACGVAPVGIAAAADIAEVSRSNVSVTHEGMMSWPDNEVRGQGTWWLKKAGDSITIKLVCDNFYCEVRVVNFAENVDYVRAMAPRKELSPAFDKFVKMFGFNGK